MQKGSGHSKSCVLFVNPTTHCIEGKYEVEDPCHLADALCLLDSEAGTSDRTSHASTSRERILLAVGTSEILYDSDEPHKGAISVLSVSRVRRLALRMLISSASESVENG